MVWMSQNVFVAMCLTQRYYGILLKCSCLKLRVTEVLKATGHRQEVSFNWGRMAQQRLAAGGSKKTLAGARGGRGAGRGN